MYADQLTIKCLFGVLFIIPPMVLEIMIANIRTKKNTKAITHDSIKISMDMDIPAKVKKAT